MARTVISNIWGQNATNRQIFSEDEIAQGIEYKGPVVSPQLNGIAFNLYTYVDNLQRANAAWNPLKDYTVGDTVNIRVIYNDNQLDMNFACIAPGKSHPLVQKNFVTTFNVDSQNQVAVFIITDDGTHKITEYVGTNWVYLQNAGAYITSVDLSKLSKRLNEVEEQLQQAINTSYNFIYPIGSIYISLNSEFNPDETFKGTHWEKIKSGYFLEATQIADNVANEVEPGLPNIKGILGRNERAPTARGEVWVDNFYTEEESGCFRLDDPFGVRVGLNAEYLTLGARLRFNASFHNPIYQDNVTTVQPRSILCFMWKRVS